MQINLAICIKARPRDTEEKIKDIFQMSSPHWSLVFVQHVVASVQAHVYINVGVLVDDNPQEF